MFFILMIFFSPFFLLSHTKVDIVVVDQSDIPIEGAHVFILNSTIGEITDAQGKCQLTYPAGMAHQIVVSHISYENVYLGSEDVKGISGVIEVRLKGSDTRLDEFVLVAKRDNKWKRNFKLFFEVFVGNSVAANRCEIVNPEVLRFDNQDGKFTTTATDALILKNDFLGYEIEYILEELIVKKDKSSHYIGQAKFTDLFQSDIPNNISKRREKAYKASRRHFFKSLIDNNLEHDGYEVSVLNYELGVFKELFVPTRDELIKYDEQTGFYKLSFPEFLQVSNKKIKEIGDSYTKKYSKKESFKFQNTQSVEVTEVRNAVSQLYKIAPTLILDEYGNVYNSSKLREYGYWAEQRMADMVPLNYKIALNEGSYKPTLESYDNLDEKENKITLQDFLQLFAVGQNEQVEILNEISSNWSDQYYAPLLEVVRMTTDDFLLKATNKLLSEKSEGQIKNYYDGLVWLWGKNFRVPEFYADLKAALYQYLDPKFKKYFEGRADQAIIEFDEILWGGVKQDGIPPLRYPQMVGVENAEYLSDSDVVFGMYINGMARAYPKRILAWHEFFVDSFRETAIAGVYCTLCGTVIAYDMTFDGKFHNLGTSGFLYRSNKLMYDEETQSLWSTIEGKPVVGPLIGKGISLKSYPVVTTTWKQWKIMHPNTEVLSLKTGHDRNYGEGEAYNSYFSTDDLMFPVPNLDTRLKNKDEVFVLKIEGYKSDPFAIAIKYLKKEKLYQGEIAGTDFLIISEKDGLSRAYESKGVEFDSYKNGKLLDGDKQEWIVGEDKILSPSGKSLNRLQGHNIFWFAWVNAFPGTRLVFN